MSFRFDVSDDSENSAIAGAPLGEGTDKEVAVAIPAKEIEVSNKSLCSSYDSKTTKFVLSDSKVLTCVRSIDVEHDLRHAADSSCLIAEALSADTDLLPHVYEGGLKVWECSVDLAVYLATQRLHFNGLRVLELGCGSGLPGLYALGEGASVHFQDYNEEVVKRLTIPNVILNGDEEKLKKCRFFSGDWESLESLLLQDGADAKYDVILTSETIYSPSSYRKLHSIMASLLKPEGVVYLAAKTCYFGVGGGTREFEEYVRMESAFDLAVVAEFTEGVNREILLLTLKKSK